MGNAPPNWNAPSFDDGRWKTAWAPFGDYQRFLQTRTRMDHRDLWLRKTFELEHDIDGPLVLRMRAEGHVEVFINGVLATPEQTVCNYLNDRHWDFWNWNRYVRMYPVVRCAKQVRLRKGKNVLAVHCRGSHQAKTYVDVGLYVANDNVDIESMMDKAADRAPDNSHLHTALALRFVEQERWGAAARQFHQSARLSDEQYLPKWMWAAMMYRQAEEDEGLHNLTAEIIERFTKDDSAETLARLAKACLLAKPTAKNLEGLVEIVDRALNLDSRNPSAQVAKALAEYRSDNIEGAIQAAQECGDANRQALCVLSLAHVEMGMTEMARDKLAQCVAANAELPVYVSLRKEDAAHEAVFLKILVEEVERKLITD